MNQGLFFGTAAPNITKLLSCSLSLSFMDLFCSGFSELMHDLASKSWAHLALNVCLFFCRRPVSEAALPA